MGQFEFTRTQIPVYLPDETVIAVALISGSRKEISIRLETTPLLALLMEEQLVSLSINYINVEAIEAEVAKETEALEGGPDGKDPFDTATPGDSDEGYESHNGN